MVVYQGGEKILAYHGPLLYEATIIHIYDEDPDEVYYRVHYRGWAKKWDENITKDRILPINDKNMVFKTQLEERIRKNQGTRLSANQMQQQPQKNQADGMGAAKTELDIEESTTPAIELSIPHGLKIILVNDWRRITRDGVTPKFPREPNADSVLDDFLERALRRYDGARRKHASDVVNGLRDWLDHAIPVCLLYDQERLAYDAAVQDLHDSMENGNSVDGDSDDESKGPKGEPFGNALNAPPHISVLKCI